jgi:hypothetical protein
VPKPQGILPRSDKKPGGVWDRRDSLQRTLSARFDVVVRGFGLRDACSQLAIH